MKRALTLGQGLRAPKPFGFQSTDPHVERDWNGTGGVKTKSASRQDVYLLNDGVLKLRENILVFIRSENVKGERDERKLLELRSKFARSPRRTFEILLVTCTLRGQTRLSELVERQRKPPKTPLAVTNLFHTRLFWLDSQSSAS